jgi:hypothetical protein
MTFCLGLIAGSNRWARLLGNSALEVLLGSLRGSPRPIVWPAQQHLWRTIFGAPFLAQHLWRNIFGAPSLAHHLWRNIFGALPIGFWG